MALNLTLKGIKPPPQKLLRLLEALQCNHDEFGKSSAVFSDIDKILTRYQNKCSGE